MEVRIAARLALLVGLAAVSAPINRAAAELSDSSTVVIASDDASPSFAAPVGTSTPTAEESIEMSDLVVLIGDDAPPRPSFQRPAARGEIALVGDDAATTAVATADGVVIADSSVVPAGGFADGASWRQALATGPRRPAPSAGVRTRPLQGPAARGPSADSVAGPSYDSAIQLQAEAPAAHPPIPTLPPRTSSRSGAAVRVVTADPSTAMAETFAEPVAPAAEAIADPAPAVQTIQSPLEHAQDLLVNAYQLSLRASNESEYSQIIQWCAAALRVDLDGESRRFSAELAAWALNRRGQARADEGQRDLAMADFRAALKHEPENWRALHNQAVTLAQAGEFADAFDQLSRVIALNPKFGKAYSNRATLYVQAGEYERALADFERAIAADPKLLAALVGHGRVCHLKGKLDDALVSFNAAVECEPDNAEIFCSRADLLADLGRYEDALMDYASAIELNNSFEHAYRNGAWLLATCPDESIRSVEGALAGAEAALDCGYGERHAALDTLAAALANAGRFDEAISTLEQAIEVAPDDAKLAYEARRDLYESGEPFRSQPVGASIASSDSTAAAGTQQAVYDDVQ